jgi:putative flippase GtrA
MKNDKLPVLYRRIIHQHSQKIRFAMVGAINTTIDFGLFFLVGLLSHSPILANYISTTCGLSFSYFANKKFTFKAAKGNPRKELALFLLFTLVGLWVLQPISIAVALTVLSSMHTEWQKLLCAKLMATIVTLTWNYLTYSRFVFKHNSNPASQ